MPPQEQNGQKGPIDPKSLLLPKKEGPSADSTQRINAGALLAQEERAGTEGITKPEEQKPAPGEPAAAPAEPSAPKPDSVVKPLQTYSGDISQAVEGGASMVSIVAAEAARHGKNPEPEAAAPEASAHNYSWIFIGVGVFLLIAAIGVVTYIFVRPGGALQQTEYQAPFIAVDDVVEVPATPATERDVLMQALNKSREEVNLSVGLIAQLFVGVPKKGSSPAQEYPPQQLLPLLAPNIPQDLLRTINPTYLLGVHSYDENQAFLILSVDSYQQAYSGLLQWEGTMRGELLPLFSRTPPIVEGTASSSATSTAQQLARTTFSDQVVSNHDARVLLNPDNEILLLWTFLNRNTVVITTNESTLNEIIRRTTTTTVIPQP